MHGVVDAVRGVLWARRRQPDDVAYFAALGHERFSPPALLRQAVEAENAGFDGVCCSDHLAPWWDPASGPPAACGNAWVWLGAAGHATRNVALGTAVTGLVHRYNPVVVAQQVATLESLYPGRTFLGVGSGEAMNEVPAGLDWPSVAEQQCRTEEALEIIVRLLNGETVDFRGRHFRTDGARIYLDVERRPPVFMSAFGPRAAAIAGRLADGVWTLGDPAKAPAVIGAYRKACEDAAKPPGEIIVQGLMSWAETDDAALEHSRVWKAALVDANYADDIHDPGEVGRLGAQVSDTKWKLMGAVSSDPAVHVRRMKAMRALGATVVVMMNVGGADPGGALRTYGTEVLPALRE
ncbi:LLM class flavin-dependent oxidoreductase [Mycolicibacter sinensis]|uniref:LLM class flavin-dependent oxidoreductase n=1 Tax=Mycolicibacter sinensis (strain JDM601) TaxID=875328 RepID=UPI0009ED0322|nr:LLM class flavin-dependent oxidoreductase [Mycolicibacter sinensis]